MINTNTHTQKSLVDEITVANLLCIVFLDTLSSLCSLFSVHLLHLSLYTLVSTMFIRERIPSQKEEEEDRREKSKEFLVHFIVFHFLNVNICAARSAGSVFFVEGARGKMRERTSGKEKTAENKAENEKKNQLVKRYNERIKGPNDKTTSRWTK